MEAVSSVGIVQKQTPQHIPGREKEADRQHQLLAPILLDQEADHEKCQARDPEVDRRTKECVQDRH
jgi:hypothetical protein